MRVCFYAPSHVCVCVCICTSETTWQFRVHVCIMYARAFRQAQWKFIASGSICKLHSCIICMKTTTAQANACADCTKHCIANTQHLGEMADRVGVRSAVSVSGRIIYIGTRGHLTTKYSSASICLLSCSRID